MNRPYKIIPLTKGYETMVDPEDYEWLSQYKWRAHVINKDTVEKVYAVRSAKVDEYVNGKRVNIFMHRAIVKPPPEMLVDHEDGDSVNNRRYNLRVASKAQNSANTVTTSLSGYRGVGKVKNRWRARAGTAEGGDIYLGYYDTAEEAAMAYDRKAIELHGPFAWLNFPRETYPELVDLFHLKPAPEPEDIPF
jgi:hypothetical protein